MNKIICVVILVLVLFVLLVNKSSFNDLLINSDVTELQPKNFPPLTENVPGMIKLEPPVVPEEIGLAMKYPQGVGVGMSKLDSNAFTPDKPGTLLTQYEIPEAYGESSLTDPYGVRGAGQGSRILKIKNVGSQSNFKPLDESVDINFAKAYTQSNTEVPTGLKQINDSTFINYADGFVPSENLFIQSSPGQTSNLNNCETTYPNTEKYEQYCITEGDIPYGKIVNGRVNPRLVSRWQSYTGDYSREQALGTIDGVLYPMLNIPKKTV